MARARHPATSERSPAGAHRSAELQCRARSPFWPASAPVCLPDRELSREFLLTRVPAPPHTFPVDADRRVAVQIESPSHQPLGSDLGWVQTTSSTKHRINAIRKPAN